MVDLGMMLWGCIENLEYIEDFTQMHKDLDLAWSKSGMLIKKKLLQYQDIHCVFYHLKTNMDYKLQFDFNCSNY